MHQLGEEFHITKLFPGCVCCPDDPDGPYLEKWHRLSINFVVNVTRPAFSALVRIQAKSPALWPNNPVHIFV